MSQIKISKNTLKILTNFQSISNQFIIDEEKCIRTFSNNTIAVADIEEVIPNMNLFSLNEFLNLINLFNYDDLVFEFKENHVVLSDKNSKSQYVFCHPDTLPNKMKYEKLNSEKIKNYDKFIASFTMTDENLSIISKACNVLGHSNIAIKMQDGLGNIIVTNPANPNSSNFSRQINGEGNCDFRILVNDINFMKGNYQVKVSTDRIKFINNDIPIFYIIYPLQD